ncbi:MAG: hypothetical protein HDT51_00510 [Alistipes sp.]|nr:hypothetical protein [Alistipes sp.]
MIFIDIPDTNFKDQISSFDRNRDGRISVSEAARIEKIELWNITTGDIKVASLEGIEYCTALTYLYCCCSQLPTLDVSRNTQLEKLCCFGNQLTALDVSRNTVLEILNCSQNQLTTLNVRQNTALKTLLCFENQLMTLDVSNCKNLQSLSLSPMPSLKTLYMATGQEIPTMDIPNTTQIIHK